MNILTTDDLFNEEPPPKVFQLTPEQETILESALINPDSMMMIAMAGCSKSTMLEILARALPIKPSCIIVFAKKNQLELEKRFTDADSKLSHFGKNPGHFAIMTANSLGHRAWAKAVNKRLNLQQNKIGDILKEVLSNRRDLDREAFGDIIALIRRARVLGYVPSKWNKRSFCPSWDAVAESLYQEPNEDYFYLAETVLNESIRQAYFGTIDFDDQIYMSALFGGIFPRFPRFWVDEAQDLSPLNHIQVRLAAADQIYAVGDPRQAIFAFRGADSSSMDSLRKLRDHWIDLPLSTTFRCPRLHVERQQTHAVGFTAHESNREGSVSSPQEWKVEDLQGQVAILCRNNAPLLSCALKIIKKGIGCSILGGEVGKQLINLSKKLSPKDDESILEAIPKLKAWSALEVAKANANENESRATVIRDKEDCLMAIYEGCDKPSVGDARAIMRFMFAAENLRLVLATGHKAKGLEWDTVVHLDPWRIPSKQAKQAAERGNLIPLEQDMNLKYVIETRSKDALVFANLEDMQE